MNEQDSDYEGDAPPAEENPPPASEKQVKFVRVLQRKLELNDEGLSELVEEVTGKSELEELSIREASELIDQLHIQGREQGVDLDSQPKVTDKQIGFIRSLKRRAHLTAKEFEELLEKRCGTANLEDVGRRDASALIDELLKRANEGQAGGGKKAKAAKKAAPPPPQAAASFEEDEEDYGEAPF